MHHNNVGQNGNWRISHGNGNNPRQKGIEHQSKGFPQFSSIHGMTHVGARERPAFERICWVMILLLSLTLAICLFVPIVKTYYDQATFITETSTSYPVWVVDFPAVTICPTSWINIQALQMELSQQGNKFIGFRQTEDVSYFAEMLAKIASVTQGGNRYLEEMTLGTEQKIDDYHPEIASIIKKVTYRCADMLAYCEWEGKERNCSELFHPHATDQGICCTFNSMFWKESLVPYTSLIESGLPDIFLDSPGSSTVDFATTTTTGTTSTNTITTAFVPGSSSITCGTNIATFPQNMTTPSYPELYPNNEYCEWVIQVSPGNTVRVSFDTFEVEDHASCDYDYVAYFDGLDTSSTFVAKYCGDTKPPDLVSTSNVMTVIFSSDLSEQRAGFTAHVFEVVTSGATTATTAATSTTIAATTTTAPANGNGCNTSLSGDSGTFASPVDPLEPSRYPLDTTCEWIIQVETGFKILLSFPTFSVEYAVGCGWDSVSAFDENNEAIGPPLCGTGAPSLLSPSNYMKVVFISDDYVRREGFTANYVKVDATSTTGVPPTAATTTVSNRRKKRSAKEMKSRSFERVKRDAGMPDDLSLSHKVKRLDKDGPMLGLRLALWKLPSNHQDYLMFDGYQVKVHSPYDFIEGSRGRNIVQERENVVISVDAEHIASSKTVREMSLKRRKCVIKGDKSKDIRDALKADVSPLHDYTEADCLQNCRAKLVLDKCHCLPFFWPWHLGMHKTCDSEGLKCLASSLDLLFAPQLDFEDSEELYPGPKCSCPSSCDKTTYGDSIDKLTLRSDHPILMKLKESTNSETPMDPNILSVVNVNFKDYEVSKLFVRREFFSVYDVIAAFGGIFALCLGFSLISIVELIYWFCIRPLTKKKK